MKVGDLAITKHATEPLETYRGKYGVGSVVKIVSIDKRLFCRRRYFVSYSDGCSRFWWFRTDLKKQMRIRKDQSLEV